MATVEHLAFALRQEGRGVHVLLWEDKPELHRVLALLLAALGDWPTLPLLVPAGLGMLQERIGARIDRQLSAAAGSQDGGDPDPHPLWVLFLEQAASVALGPRLNGLRRPLSDPHGTLLVIRRADYDDFRRHAPDLASFFGPRIHAAGDLLLVCTEATRGRLRKGLPGAYAGIFEGLPGVPPTAAELEAWDPVTFPGGGD